MRILYLGDTSSPHFEAWPSYFAAEGHDVHSCHVSSSAPARPLPGVVEHGPAAGAGGTVRGSWLLGAATVARLRRALRPDVVHSHQLVPAGYLGERGGAEPHVATAWGSEVALASGIRRRLVRRVARGADLLTADSHHLLDLLRAAGADEERLRWVPWGVDPRWAAPALGMSRAQAAARVGLPTDREIVLSHRGPAPLYRQDCFLQAMVAATASRPDALGVIPAMDRSPGRRDTARLREQIGSLGLASAVEIVESWAHADMAFAFRAASVCVSVPETDSAPTSVFEALAAGTPAIVSELPWVREPVYEDAQLETVAVGDSTALAAGILAALEGSLDGAIDTNRELVSRSLDRNTLFDAMGAEYERLASGAR